MNRPLAALLLVPIFAFAEPIEDPAQKKDGSHAVSDDAQTALKKMSVARGLRAEVWASEPLLANPIALSFDNRGRAFVAETYRRRTSVPDIRKHDDWVIENLALRSVEERVAFLKGKYPEKANRPPSKDLPDFNGDGQFDWRDLEVESERVKVIEDSNGDGRADQSRVLAAVASLAAGAGAGVCVHGDEVFYTCVPDLWKIRADGTTEKLLSGFGVHVAYSGHDMHGPKIGPDGRLYWSIADCGAKVAGKEGQVIDNPDSGAIFRCELDGSKLELVAKGLRNPQSLAWNDVGDLFTGDNNADGGDKARWIHVVEGADYGWRIGWQFLPKLGAWNSEGMWHLDTAETNLAILPPVGHIGHGPAGIAHYPGTGLPDAYRDHFFMADFPGGVRAFKLIPKGASYTVENPGDILQDNSPQKLTGKVLWGLYPSDVAFAPGGGLFVLDWVQGWEKTGKGRIFRVFDPATDASALVQETKRLLNEGFAKRSNDELGALLGHADQRVRLGAQFALVEAKAIVPLQQSIVGGRPLVQRLHGLWGLTQIAKMEPKYRRNLLPLAADGDPEMRAQWAKSVGRIGVLDEVETFLTLVADPSPRVRFAAVEALARLKERPVPDVLFRQLRRAGEMDAFTRHAVSRVLAATTEPEALGALTEHNEASVRLVALLALRQQASPEVARFLGASDLRLRLEAARAIHDASIPEAWPQLAALAEQTDVSEAFWRRAVNANYLLGTADAAERLGRVATNAQMPPAERLFAVESLAIWNAPFGRDRITGLWRDLPPRASAKGAREVAATIVPALLADHDESIQLAIAEMAGALKVMQTEPALLPLVADARVSGKVRAAALRALAAMDSPKLAEAVRAALSNTDNTLLETARRLAAKASPELAVRVNAAVLGKGSVWEQQEALTTIAAQPIPEADHVLSTQLDALLAGQISPALQLDLLEAVAVRSDPALKQKLAAYETARKSTDPLAKWRECLNGGDAKSGKEIFYEKAEAACLRCHKVKGEGGDVGPDLAGSGKRHDREYLLRAIIEPNAEISPGYENVLLILNDQNIIAGILRGEDTTSVTIVSLADGKPTVVQKASVKERTRVPSPMPPGLGDALGKRAVRDLVEFLANLK